ncbi:MAG: hypothetical protein IVW53_10135 [Chloroflexi bacterium]|nr:hypothetical protein [Chloroflexota bacterium]
MTTETNPTITVVRTCIGSKTFGIEAHEAPIEDFPVQPSRKDGLGTMCRPHWTEYTRALRKASIASKAAGTALPVGTGTPPVVHGAKKAKKPEPIRTVAESPAVTRRRAKIEAELAAAGGAGTEAGQQILEDADVARASGLLLAMSEPLTVEEAG